MFFDGRSSWIIVGAYLDNFEVDREHFDTMVLFLRKSQEWLYMYYAFDFDYPQMEIHNPWYLNYNQFIFTINQSSKCFTELTISSTKTRWTIASEKARG